jgi:hypothetical protein
LCRYSVERIEADFWTPISIQDVDILVQHHSRLHQKTKNIS